MHEPSSNLDALVVALDNGNLIVGHTHFLIHSCVRIVFGYLPGSFG